MIHTAPNCNTAWARSGSARQLPYGSINEAVTPRPSSVRVGFNLLASKILVRRRFFASGMNICMRAHTHIDIHMHKYAQVPSQFRRSVSDDDSLLRTLVPRVHLYEVQGRQMQLVCSTGPWPQQDCQKVGVRSHERRQTPYPTPRTPLLNVLISESDIWENETSFYNCVSTPWMLIFFPRGKSQP